MMLPEIHNWEWKAVCWAHGCGQIGQQLSKPEHVFCLCGPIATALNDSRPSPQLAKAAGATALLLLPVVAVVIPAG